MRALYSRSIKLLIVLLLVISSTHGIVAKAFWDSSAPEIKSVQVDKKQASKGDTITLSINAVDPETPIKEGEIWYNDGEGYLQTYDATYNPDTKMLQVEIPIDDFSSLGKWTITRIWFYDYSGSFKVVDSTSADLSGGNFEVIPKVDTTPPSFTSMNVDKTQVYSGDAVKVSVAATDSESAISEIQVNYIGANGTTRSIKPVYNWFTNKYEATLPITDSMGLGKWTVSSITLKDDKGNTGTVMSASKDLSAGTFEIVKKPDSEAPRLIALSIDKTEVRIGETAKVSMEATDNESGVADVQITYQDPSLNLVTKTASYNSGTNKYEASISIPDGAKLGTWAVKSVTLKDNKGNAATVTNSLMDLTPANFTVIENADVESPVLKGITVDKNETNLGNPVEVRINAEDIQSGIAEIKVSFLAPSGETITKSADYNWFDNNYLVSFAGTDFSDIGDWKIDSVYLKDTKGNEKTIYNSNIYTTGDLLDLSSGNFHVSEDKGNNADSFKYYGSNVTLSDETINGNVYIGPNAVVTINGNVTINGDLYILGSYVLNGNLNVTGTLNMTQNLGQIPVYLDGQPLTAINGKLTISGKTLPIVSLSIEGQQVPIGSDGTFKLENLDVSGKEGITMTFVDPSGNQTVRKFLVKQVTKAAPAAPKVNPITDQSTTVTGTTEANADVTVSVGSTVIGSGKADASGQFAISIPKQKAGITITVTVKDFAGNESSTKVVTTVGYSKINVQLNGKSFTSGYFGNGSAYVHWRALDTFKIPYSFKGNGVFLIEGRSVQAETINGGLFIRWNQLSPKVTYKSIAGGYNFIYSVATPIKVQLNGMNFTQGYMKDGVAYVHWKALDTFKIPYKFLGNGQFTIEGRSVQAEVINGGLYIRWNLLSPGNVTYKSITGGYNFIYTAPSSAAPAPIKVQLNGVNFTQGYMKDGYAYVYWRALDTFKIPYTFKGNGVFVIEGRTVQAETINGALYIRWSQLSPGKITYARIIGGYNFIYAP